jgi:hypothetical protein
MNFRNWIVAGAIVVAVGPTPANAFKCGMECKTWSYSRTPPGQMSESARAAEIARCRAARDADCQRKKK